MTTTLAVDRLITAPEVATYLGIPLVTLYSWRTRGLGPRAVRVGKHLRFRSGDVEAWVERHIDDQSGVA